MAVGSLQIKKLPASVGSYLSAVRPKKYLPLQELAFRHFHA